MQIHLHTQRPDRSLWEARPRGDRSPVKSNGPQTTTALNNEGNPVNPEKSCKSCLFKRNRGGLRTASIINESVVVFNIEGNKYRLVVDVDYSRQAMFVKFIGTHAQYDRLKLG